MLAPKDKREAALIAQGKTQEKAAAKLRAQNAENKSLKKEVKAVRREANREIAEVEAEPTHKLAMGGGAVVGAGLGVAGQHYGADKYIENKYVRRGALPTLGVVGLIAGFFMKGAAGDLVFGLGAGTAIGSGSVSLVKHLTK